MLDVSRGDLMGTVGNSPELRTGASGAKWTRVSVAIHRKGDAPTEWWDVTLFEQQAEQAARLLRPGAKVRVWGELEVESWIDAEGKPRRSTRLKGDAFRVVRFANEQTVKRGAAEAEPQAAAAS